MASLSIAARQVALDTALDLIDAGAGPGLINIYDGIPPATPDTALSGNTLLATLTMSDPAFGAANTSGTATAGSITQDSAADATGTATFFRVVDSDGVVRMQGTVTATGGGGDLELSNTSITINDPVVITSFTVTLP